MIVAHVTFWGAGKGGRHTPPQDGFQPLLLIGGVKTSCKVLSKEVSVRQFEFDKSYEAEIHLMFPEIYEKGLQKDQVLEFYEGNKKIGEGLLSKSVD